MSLNTRIVNLETEIKALKSKIQDLSRNLENQPTTPYSIVEGVNKSEVTPTDIKTGLGAVHGGNLVWNDAEMKFPPYGIKPSTVPTEGYNLHGHSRFAGGALDINTLELVEYDIDWDTDTDYSKHSQGFWLYTNLPQIKKADDGVTPKIGNLDIDFDATTGKWVAGSGNIDVETTFLVRYVWMLEGNEVSAGTEGAVREIKTDSNGNEMKSPLLSRVADESTVAGRNENLNKSNVYWDKDARVFRFYAVFKPAPEEAE